MLPGQYTLISTNLKLKHVAFMHPSPHIGETPGLHHFPLNVFKNWSNILLIWNLSLSAPKFKETLMAVIKHRGIAETAISSVIKTIDSITNHSYSLLAK